MKKIKIFPTDKSCKFHLFNSTSLILEWLSTGENIFNEQNCSIVLLQKNGNIEAEWLGFESHQINGVWRYIHLIRLAVICPTKNSSGDSIKLSMGWVSKEIFPLETKENDFYQARLMSADEDQHDIDELFKQVGIQLLPFKDK